MRVSGAVENLAADSGSRKDVTQHGYAYSQRCLLAGAMLYAK